MNYYKNVNDRFGFRLGNRCTSDVFDSYGPIDKHTLKYRLDTFKFLHPFGMVWLDGVRYFDIDIDRKSAIMYIFRRKGIRTANYLRSPFLFSGQFSYVQTRDKGFCSNLAVPM